MSNFKETWEKTDEVCSNCNQVTKRVRGITRQNIKRLFSIKFELTEMLITLMLIMLLLLAFAYMNETKTSRDWIESMTSGGINQCLMVCNNQCYALTGNITNNLENVNQTITIPKLNFNLST